MMETMGVYIHIPFCVKKCLYCDFLSYDNRRSDLDGYVNRLMEEIVEKKRHFMNRSIRTVYFGGGTPSLLSSKQAAGILACLRDHGGMENVVEVTIEANPGTLTRDGIAGFLEAGINRVSIGLQSTQDEELRRIGRIHTYEDFRESYRMLREEGCRNISVDLMTGLPGQSLESFREGLLKVIALGPEHLSCYGLTVEEGTPLCTMVENKQVFLDDALEREMYETLLEEAGKAGYEHYEISNFAKPGYQSRHNNIYWEMGAYLGLGLGASSFIDGTRFRNIRDMDQYLKADELMPEEVVKLDRRSWKEEWMFLGLRKMEGVSRSKYQEFFGNTMDQDYGDVLVSLIEQGLLSEDGDRISLTKKGLTFANGVFHRFLLD